MKTLSRKLPLLLTLALPLAGARAGTYTCDFTQGFDTNRWSIGTSYPYDCYSNTIDARGVTFQRVADPPTNINPRGSYWSGLNLNVRAVTTNGGFIIGDFTMTYTYTNLTNFTAQGSWEFWAINYVKARMGWGMGLDEQHLAIGRRAASVEGWSGSIYQDVWWGRWADSVYYGYHMTNATSVGDSATFKVVRTNGVQSYYANDLWFGTDGMDLNGGWYTTNDMSDFTLVLEQQDAAEHVGVTFQSFSISGPSIADATWPPRPVLELVSAPSGNLAFQWDATPGRAYQVQTTTSLSPANWTNLGSSFVASTSPVSVTNSIGPDAQRFYRVVVP